ncbi:VOC family protein [Kribbella qitaiheensis]|uniref:VOC family protein n=1 Tax=Kribbella qitaiheensis TaxID=1544730 RepID=A0A7G6WYM7_9ACTN|nr:VOC family protein [Kribbella qitaiheensis]QNE19092.1 VOC family protein [Kribbella qitaiheensis]
MTIKAVLAVIPVTDLDKACEWYESFFGRAADTRPMDTLAEWHLSELGVVQVFQEPDRAGHTMVNFAVEDLDTTISTLAAADIHTTDPTKVSQGRQRLVSTTDPDNNQLGLIETLA